jgi:hypothetical protein
MIRRLGFNAVGCCTCTGHSLCMHTCHT